ncbi:MAG TPA: helix-turn-helix domain-containing protein [Myxococcales bacterium]|nr:helix-turn-helix domain-containing protein [Myxococcales bacterium]
MAADASTPAGFATVALLLERLVCELQGLRADVATARRAEASAAVAEPEGLWTAADVAGYLRCSRSKVYQAAEAGNLPSLHVGGQLRFEPEQVRAWARNAAAPDNRVVPMRRRDG